MLINKKNNLLKSLIIKNKLKLLLYFLINVIILFANIIILYIIGDYIDTLIIKKNLDNIYSFTLQITVSTIILLILSYISNILNSKLVIKISYDIQYQLVKKIKSLSLLEVNKTNPSYLSQRIYNDSSTIATFIVNNGITFIIEFINLVTVLILVFKLNASIAILLLLSTPIYIFLYNIFKKTLYKKGLFLKEEQNKFFSVISNQIHNLRHIKINSLCKESSLELNNKFNILYEKNIDFIKTSSRFSLVGTSFSNFFKIILVFYGGIKIISGELTVGAFTILNNYFSIYIKSLSYFLQFTKIYQDFLISYDRLKNILLIDSEPVGKLVIRNIESISVENLTFGYDKILFDNYNFTFNKGYVYYIKGGNGVGKSSFIDILLGVNNNYSGKIYYNNNNIKELDSYNLRKKSISICEQSPYLFNDTIRKNLTYGVDEYTEESICYYTNKLHFEHILNRYENGFESIISFNNDNISGGEKQKISLARVFIKNSEILILDEPTSYLDEESIEILKELIIAEKNNKIIIIVSHDSKLEDIADEMIYFQNKCLNIN